MIIVKRKLKTPFALFKHYTKMDIFQWLELSEENKDIWRKHYDENPYVDITIEIGPGGSYIVEPCDTIVSAEGPVAYKVKGIDGIQVYIPQHAQNPVIPDWLKGGHIKLNEEFVYTKPTIDHSKYRCINPRKETSV